MMLAAAALIVVVALAAPWALRLEGVSPGAAALLWVSNLAVRAMLSLYAALFIILYLPRTEMYDVLSQWCWHAVLPFVATHLRLSGHDLGDAALLGPIVVLATSLSWAAIGVCRAASTVRGMLRSLTVGAGPGDSVILGDGQVVIAAAGLRRPKIVVSAGALVAMDDDELAAGLDHERGHIARRHRFVVLAAEVLGAGARFLPGTRHAKSELLFHLERDADQYAVDRHHDPASLVSAICKAAESAFTSGNPSVAALGGGNVVRRLKLLLDGPQRHDRTTAVALGCSAMLLAMTLVGSLALPAAAAAGVRAAQAVSVVHACPA